MAEHYTFTMYQEDGTEVTLRGNKVTLPEVVADFEAFLLGCTFSQDTINRSFGEYYIGEEYNGN